MHACFLFVHIGIDPSYSIKHISSSWHAIAGLLEIPVYSR